MSPKKRNILVVVVLLCVCAAVYLNWSYNKQMTGEDASADAALAGQKSAEEQTVSGSDDYITEYFAQARLTRQQSRDKAMDLLEQAASSETASQETIDGAMDSIAAMANYSMQETQIENLILAKNFSDCVAFMSSDGITLAVPAPAEGLAAEDVAKITDTIISETNYTAAQLKIIEVKSPAPTTSSTPSSVAPTTTIQQSAAPSSSAPTATAQVSPSPKTGTGTSGSTTTSAEGGETAINDIEID